MFGNRTLQIFTFALFVQLDYYQLNSSRMEANNDPGSLFLLNDSFIPAKGIYPDSIIQL